MNRKSILVDHLFAQRWMINFNSIKYECGVSGFCDVEFWISHGLVTEKQNTKCADEKFDTSWMLQYTTIK